MYYIRIALAFVCIIILSACSLSQTDKLTDGSAANVAKNYAFEYYDSFVFYDDVIYYKITNIGRDSIQVYVNDNGIKTDSAINIDAEQLLAPFIYFSHKDNNVEQYPFKNFEGFLTFSRDAQTLYKYNGTADEYCAKFKMITSKPEVLF